jgi:hypothetical protein
MTLQEFLTTAPPDVRAEVIELVELAQDGADHQVTDGTLDGVKQWRAESDRLGRIRDSISLAWSSQLTGLPSALTR